MFGNKTPVSFSVQEIEAGVPESDTPGGLDEAPLVGGSERESFIDNLLVRIHFIIVMIRWTGLAPWQFEFLFPGSLTSTFRVQEIEAGVPESDTPRGLEGRPMRKGSTSFGACEVRCWRWLFGNKIPVSLSVQEIEAGVPESDTPRGLDEAPLVGGQLRGNYNCGSEPPFPLLTERKVESGTSQSKSGTSVNFG